MVCTECHSAPSNGNCGLSRTYNSRYNGYFSEINRANHRLVDDLCHYFCQQARDNVEIVAKFINSDTNSDTSKFRPLDRYEAIINVARIIINGVGIGHPPTWNRKTRQALFGQREINGIMRSHGTDITVVAHEFCHGL
ncbi:MAG: hypothetical protein ACKO8H_02565, partial [Microcystis panniformis]